MGGSRARPKARGLLRTRRLPRTEPLQAEECPLGGHPGAPEDREPQLAACPRLQPLPQPRWAQVKSHTRPHTGAFWQWSGWGTKSRQLGTLGSRQEEAQSLPGLSKGLCEGVRGQLTLGTQPGATQMCGGTPRFPDSNLPAGCVALGQAPPSLGLSFFTGVWSVLPSSGQ